MHYQEGDSMLKILIGFSPWIAFFVLTGPETKQMQTAVIAGLIAFLIVGLKDLKRGFILSWGSLLFFLFMLVMVVFVRHDWIISHPWIISNSALAIIIFVVRLSK